ncbi:5-(carboxyamino)imidazole ribonucleotide synthase [Intrasporangium calvum]|uniref:N5-carboxyaminoimidazole ribonucleotide synthase n=1 Tax=Intrasporangium calvum (strain ATCC 23552 / DSM 43043 / JCM 3097 / NBRC 12989 / NCIMB 10167 / NRRL B-3866 / 7 KIP) TaxID=710696 RepID=E6SFM4_INTC7|nr:5-(carboxyamino)imidazole ribonucleotide synthase [Intrasporangium calvum]ADU47769.1 5-(carboxyamino)imidazole ribonucleotide synthase [Intrasporangium calvum DSM 43043]
MTEPKRAPGGFPVVGVVGGGQLARMMQGPAIELGIQLSVLAEDEVAAAALVVPSSPVGRHTELDHVLEFARSCDVVAFDHEHVPQSVLESLENEGIVMHPSRTALRFAQDKLAMRRRLTDLGIACPRWAVARVAADVDRFGAEVGWPVIVKTPRGGYDGKGVMLASSSADVADWLTHVGEPGPMSEGLLLEERVDFTRELAALVARSPSGQAAAWPVVETVQTGGICTEVLAPAPGIDPDLAAVATEAALRVAGELGVTGVLAVEMFEVPGPDGRPGYVVNELAMRPHNSGHWSMDGAVTGQFEQHLRAVLDLPLGDPRPHAPWTAMANVLGGDYPELYPAYRHIMARDPQAKVHMYGKGVRPGRKLGHVNVSGPDLAEVRDRARHAADFLQGVITE